MHSLVSSSLRFHFFFKFSVNISFIFLILFTFSLRDFQSPQDLFFLAVLFLYTWHYLYSLLHFVKYLLPIPVVVRSKACGSAADRLLELWVRIQPGARWFFSCECCVFSGLCVGLIARSEESYRVWCVYLSVIMNPRK